MMDNQEKNTMGMCIMSQTLLGVTEEPASLTPLDDFLLAYVWNSCIHEAGGTRYKAEALSPTLPLSFVPHNIKQK